MNDRPRRQFHLSDLFIVTAFVAAFCAMRSEAAIIAAWTIVWTVGGLGALYLVGRAADAVGHRKGDCDAGRMGTPEIGRRGLTYATPTSAAFIAASRVPSTFEFVNPFS